MGGFSHIPSSKDSKVKSRNHGDGDDSLTISPTFQDTL